jgi:hypothetical protein
MCKTAAVAMQMEEVNRPMNRPAPATVWKSGSPQANLHPRPKNEVRLSLLQGLQ